MGSPAAAAPTAFLCCGVRIDALDLEQSVAALTKAAEQRNPFSVNLCNAYVLALAERDPGFRAVLNAGSLNLADGAPVAFAGRLAGARHLRSSRRPRGAALFVETLDKGRATGLRHFLYGGTPEVVAALAAELERRLPGVDLVTESPPFRPLTRAERSETLARIEASGSQILWVGIGTPAQNYLAADFAESLSKVVVCVGAAFDFVSGAKREAPRWLQVSGLEWVFRLATEPRRLWRRYFFGNLVFLYGAIRHGVRRT